jgi:hypothetical protein
LWVFDILGCASLRHSDSTGVLERVVDVGRLLNSYARLISAWRFLLDTWIRARSAKANEAIASIS